MVMQQLLPPFMEGSRDRQRRNRGAEQGRWSSPSYGELTERLGYNLMLNQTSLVPTGTRERDLIYTVAVSTTSQPLLHACHHVFILRPVRTLSFVHHCKAYSHLRSDLHRGKTRTFKPRRDVPEGTKQYQLRKYAEATLVSHRLTKIFLGLIFVCNIWLSRAWLDFCIGCQLCRDLRW